MNPILLIAMLMQTPAVEMSYPVAGLTVYETPAIEASLDAAADQTNNPDFWEATRDYDLDPDAAEPILDELGIEIRWRMHDPSGNPAYDEVVGYTETDRDE